MKTWISHFVAGLVMMSFTMSAQAEQGPEGTWQDEQNRIILLVEKVPEGIRVKRSGQDRWYSYQRYRENQFRDSEGNTYYLNGDHSLEWEDRTGRKRIRFYKRENNRYGEGKNHLGYRNDRFSHPQDRQRDTYIERNHHRGQSGHRSIATHVLTGRWINETTGQMIQIKARNNQVIVRANRGGWENFERKDANTFVDRRGNRYDFIRNRLVYTSRNNDFRMEFKKLS